MDCRIHHNPTIDIDLDYLALLLVEAHAFVEAIVHALESDKFLPSLN